MTAKTVANWTRSKLRWLISSGVLLASSGWASAELWSAAVAVRDLAAATAAKVDRIDEWRLGHDRSHDELRMQLQRNDDRVYNEMRELQARQIEMLLMLKRDQRYGRN